MLPGSMGILTVWATGVASKDGVVEEECKEQREGRNSTCGVAEVVIDKWNSG